MLVDRFAVVCFLPGAGIVLFEVFQNVIVISYKRKVYCPLGYEPCSQVEVYQYLEGGACSSNYSL